MLCNYVWKKVMQPNFLKNYQWPKMGHFHLTLGPQTCLPCFLILLYGFFWNFTFRAMWVNKGTNIEYIQKNPVCLKMWHIYPKLGLKAQTCSWVPLNDSWFIFHNSVWSSQKPNFGRKHIFMTHIYS